MTPRPRLKRTTRPLPSRNLSVGLTCGFTLLGALVLGWPGTGSAAEGGLQIMPSGFAENFAEHGLLALFYMKRFWTLVAIFAVLAIVLNRFAFSPLLAVLEERERRIGGARKRAAELSEQAEALLGRHAQALRGARDRAQVERQVVLEQARGRAQSQVDVARGQAEEQTREARREVDAALDQARGTLRDDADQIAEAIADQLLGASA